MLLMLLYSVVEGIRRPLLFEDLGLPVCHDPNFCVCVLAVALYYT